MKKLLLFEGFNMADIGAAISNIKMKFQELVNFKLLHYFYN